MKKVIISFMLLTLSTGIYAQEMQPNVHELGLVFSNLNSFGIRYKCGNDSTMFRITSLVLNGTNTTTDYSNYTYNGINGSNIATSPTNSVGLGLNLGIEKRKWVSDKSYFYYGFDWINSYTTSTSSTVTPGTSTFSYTDINNQYVFLSTVFNNTSRSNAYTWSSGIGLVFGFIHKINDLFSVAAELEPSVSYKYTKTTSSNTNYSVRWIGNSTTGYSPSDYISTDLSQTTVNKGVTYSLTNAAASITILYRLASKAKLAK